MARIVRHTARGPIKIEPQQKPIWVCACGLSKNAPYCDGSHKACADEAESAEFEYLPDGTRRELPPSSER
jgi:CDGSH-type Zn-finger protein